MQQSIEPKRPLFLFTVICVDFIVILTIVSPFLLLLLFQIIMRAKSHFDFITQIDKTQFCEGKSRVNGGANFQLCEPIITQSVFRCVLESLIKGETI